MNAIDPVCGMDVEIEKAQWKSEHKGETYYFCGPGCKRTFDKDPEAILHQGPKPEMMDH